jgi:hypothetical protein
MFKENEVGMVEDMGKGDANGVTRMAMHLLTGDILLNSISVCVVGLLLYCFRRKMLMNM